MAGDRERAMNAAWEINVSAAFATNQAVRDRFLAIGRRRHLRLTVLGAQMQAVAGHDTSARLGSLHTPTLVVHGTADELVPVSNGHMLARLIPGAQLHLLEGAGHMFFWEAPGDAAALVAGFAERHSGGLTTNRSAPA
jgi:pimeloyl-ACP methyl ester carboxylesterase